MTDAALVEFIRYNNWANQQVLAACQALTDEQMAGAMPGAYGTIRATLEHIIRAEARYASRFTGDYLEPPFKWEDRPSVEQIGAYGAQIGAQLLDIAARYGPNHLIRQEWDNQPVQYQAMALFIQIVNHGIEHRTNITTFLNSLGLPVPEIDNWGYMSAHPAQFQVSSGKVAGA